MKRRIYIAISVILTILLLVGMLCGALYHMGKLPFLSREGWIKDEQGNACYLNYWGKELTGWHELDGKRYYFDTNGAMQTGWLELSEGTYYLDESGLLQTGWLTIEEKTYYLNEQGIRHSGWLTFRDETYYFAQDGTLCTGWQEIEGKRYLFSSQGQMRTGWITWNTERYYFYKDGAMATGWVQVDGHTYYLDEKGVMYDGWLELDGKQYYLKASGALATGWIEREGKLRYFDQTGAMLTEWQIVDGLNYYFCEDGEKAMGQVLADQVAARFSFGEECTIILNRDNPLPADWDAYPIEVEDGWSVDGRCYNQFVQMLADCREAGNETGINSAYRSPEEQQEIWDNRVARYIDEGATEEEAIERVSKEVAIPGYSEHQLGFAVDIDGFDAHDWMAENSWRYGFVIRYPEDKQEITGTVYEPWHVRFVGYDLAKLMYDEDLCLEEYYELYG